MSRTIREARIPRRRLRGDAWFYIVPRGLELFAKEDHRRPGFVMVVISWKQIEQARAALLAESEEGR